MTLPIKRSITISGHRTSITLEDEFWSALKDIAKADSKSLAELIAAIDKTTLPDSNFSSAIRVYILNHYRLNRQNGQAQTD